MSAMPDWNEGEPQKSGYYLAAWRIGTDRLAVSEMWFNPDSVEHWWWTRGYTDQPRPQNPMHAAVREEVVAWMPLPDPPEDV